MQLQKTNNEILAVVHYNTVSEYTEHLIRLMESGVKLTEKGKVYDESTIRTYRAFLRYFNEFQQLHSAKFTFAEMNYRTAEAFKGFLNEKNLTKNSVSAYTKKLKAVLKEAFRDGLSLWNGSGLKTPIELTTQVSQNLNEVRKMKEVAVTKSAKNILDQYIINNFLGLRYHTFKEFITNPKLYIKEYEGANYVDITDSKNDKQFIIPLGETVLSILQENNYQFNVVSRQFFSSSLKLLAEKAGIINVVIKNITVGGKKSSFAQSKYKMISSHTARRSFATRLSRKLSKDNVANLTTHSSVQQLNTYIREENIDKIKHLFGNEVFNEKI